MLEAFKRYDIRGSYPEEINETLASMIGSAYSHTEKVVIGGDLRTSTPFLKNALLYSLNADKVCDVGIAQTDLVAFCSKDRNAKGIIVTASHSPWNFNGFKFVNETSTPFTNEQLNELKHNTLHIKNVIQRQKFYKPNYEDAYDAYYGRIKELIGSFHDIQVYAINSAALPSLKYALTNGLLKVKLIGKSYVLNPTYPSNPSEELAQKIGINKGVMLDGDGDRGMIVENSRVVDAHYLIYSFSTALDAKKIVVSADFSEILKNKLEKSGINVVITRVGDVFVSNTCFNKRCDFFAEPNHHFGFPEVSYYSSGLLAGLYYNYYDVSSYVPKDIELHFDTESMENANKTNWSNIFDQIKKQYEVVNEIDGIKFKTSYGYIMIRFSGTSHNKVRIYYEAESKDHIAKLRSLIKRLLKR